MRKLRVAALVLGALAVVAPAAQFVVAYVSVPGVLARVYRTTPQPLDVRKMAVHRLRWLVAVQDPNFFRHPGVDLFTPGAGYTTITDTLVKHLFFTDFTPGFLHWREARENVVALAFDRRVPKLEQLNLFVNTVYLGSEGGREVRGFDKAARLYFGKSYAGLSDDEYLRLLAMILMPPKYHVLREKGNNKSRVRRIELLLKGDCAPAGHGDVEYPDCQETRL